MSDIRKLTLAVLLIGIAQLLLVLAFIGHASRQW